MAIKFVSTGARIVCADLRPDACPMAADKSAPTHELINETYKGNNAILCRPMQVTKKQSKP